MRKKRKGKKLNLSYLQTPEVRRKRIAGIRAVIRRRKAKQAAREPGQDAQEAGPKPPAFGLTEVKKEGGYAQYDAENSLRKQMKDQELQMLRSFFRILQRLT